MHRRPWFALALLAFACALPRPAGADEKFELYGFLRLDAVYDDSRMQHPQYAFWVLSEDPRYGPRDASEFTLYPRVSRIGVRLLPRDLDTRARIRGVVEIDFQNGGTESRETPRMRLAYFSIETERWRFLGGQDWDTYSPLYPTCHTDGVLWNAGNLGDRRPQARVTFAPAFAGGALEVALAAGATGAIDNANLDANRLLDGMEAARPQAQGLVAYARDAWGGRLVFGISGHAARTRTEKTVQGRNEFDSWSAGFHASVPLGARVTVKGEGWAGRNLSDVRGGIGQNVNPLTGEEIDAMGGWGEVGVKVSDPVSLYLGGSIDDPDDAQLPSADELEDADLSLDGTGRTRNTVAYAATRWKPWAPFLVALEYYYWVTEYQGLDRGRSNRVDLYFSYSF